MYKVFKKDVIAVFLRRNESEIIVLAKNKVKKLKDMPILRVSEGGGRG